MRILEVWLDSGIGATELNQRRNAVWDDVNETLYETVFGRNFRARDLLGANYPTRSSRNPDDTSALRTLREAAAALGDPTRFDLALSSGGVFDDAGRSVADPDDLFDVLEHDLQVNYDYTDYGRFGVWAKRTATSALGGSAIDRANPPDSFAYSPLAQTAYYTGDPGYPSNGTGYYEGETLAVETQGDTRVYRGSVGLTVQWGSRVSSATLTSTIEDLRTLEGGRPLIYNGYAVDAIVFRSVRLSGGAGVGTGFDTRSPDVRVRYLDASRSDSRWSGSRSVAGKFVGRTIDGPLGVIGTWSLNSSYSTSLKGAFSADLLP